MEPIDPLFLAAAKLRIGDALQGKPKGYRGPSHGKVEGTGKNRVEIIEVHNAEVLAGDLAMVARAVMEATPEKVPDKIDANHSVLAPRHCPVHIAKIKFDSVKNERPNTPVTIYADEAHSLLEACK